MNRTFLSTFISFLIYLANHIGEVIIDHRLDGMGKRNLFILFMMFVVLVFCADYYFNFRRKHVFMINKWVYLLLAMAIWLNSWNWPMVLVNAGIMILFLLGDRKRNLNSGT